MQPELERQGIAVLPKPVAVDDRVARVEQALTSRLRHQVGAAQ